MEIIICAKTKDGDKFEKRYEFPDSRWADIVMPNKIVPITAMDAMLFQRRLQRRDSEIKLISDLIATEIILYLEKRANLLSLTPSPSKVE